MVAGSVLAHLGLLVAILVQRAPVVELEPNWLANGRGEISYRVIYGPPGDRAPQDHKLTLSTQSQANRHRPKPSARRPVPHPLEVPSDAEVSDQSARAGSTLGTLMSGATKGHDVRIAYPVIFPDPHIDRSELPPEVKGDVIIRVTIDAEGYVVETEILKAIGHGIDEKVLAALRQWRYKPATLDGVPVPSKHDVHFHFPS